MGKRFLTSLSLLLLAAACQTGPVGGEVTREVTREVLVEVTREILVTEAGERIEVEVTRVVEVPAPPDASPTTVPLPPSAVGSAARPLQWWSAPAVGAPLNERQLAIVAETLAELTGRAVEFHLAESDTAAVEVLCDEPATAVVFMPATVYERAEECGGELGLTALRFEQPWQAGMIVVRRGRGLTTLADLDGLRWGLADPDSLPNTHAFTANFNAAGVAPGDIVVYESDTEAMLALLNGEVDFATATFIAPIIPFEQRVWEYGADDPEMWRDFAGFAPIRSPRGFITVAGYPENGGYRIRDARAAVFDVAPTIFAETEILLVGSPIPNATIVLGAEVPLGVARDVLAALEAHMADDACAAVLCSPDFFGWEGWVTADSAAFDSVRFIEANLEP